MDFPGSLKALDCRMHTVVRSGNWCNGFHAHPLRRRVFIKYTKQVCLIFSWNFLLYRKYQLYPLKAHSNVTAFTDYWFRSATRSSSFLSTTFYFSFLVDFFRFVLFFIFMFVVVGCCYCCISWRARTSTFSTTKADFISKRSDYPYAMLTFNIVDDWHESSRDRKMTSLICRQNLNLFWSRWRFSENSNYLCLWGHAVHAACRACNSTIFLSL